MDWLILRVASRHTMSLAKSLSQDGYDVWTPIQVQRVRVPRVNARRIVTEPLLKGFVFARCAHKADLARMSHVPGRYASFTVVQEFGEIAEIRDHELDGLRWIEGRVNVTAKKTDRTIPEGVKVKVGSGLFGGMTGVVRRSKRGLTLVCFNDRYSAEIPTSLLATDGSYALSTALAA